MKKLIAAAALGSITTLGVLAVAQNVSIAASPESITVYFFGYHLTLTGGVPPAAAQTSTAPTRQATPTPPRPTATPSLSVKVHIQDTSSRANFREATVEDLLRLHLPATAVVYVRLVNHNERLHKDTFGFTETDDSGRTITMEIRVLPMDVGCESGYVTTIEYDDNITCAKFTFLHELKHAIDFTSGRLVGTERAADLWAFEHMTYRNPILSSVSIRPTLTIRRTPITRTTSTPTWRRRMYDLIGQWNSWQAKTFNPPYVVDGVWQAGYWDEFCGKMWMYEELQAIRRITPAQHVRWIDAWLAVDAYHAHICSGGEDPMIAGTDHVREVWAEWSRRINETIRLQP